VLLPGDVSDASAGRHVVLDTAARDRFIAPASGSTAWDELRQDDAVEVTVEPEAVADFFACFDLTPPQVRLHVR
jgi:hypothetical protein